MARDNMCPMCGGKNPSAAKRCESCGARLEALGDALTEEELKHKRHQQEGFSWLWAMISLGLYFASQAIVLVLLRTMLDSAGYDPQGSAGIGLSGSIFFVGGIIVGVLSPGKTFIEPAVGAAIVMLPSVWWLMHIDDVAQLTTAVYFIGGLLWVMLALMGAFLGERVQLAMSAS